MDTENKIKEDIISLAEFYGLDKPYFNKILELLPLDKYVELVLGVNDFDVVVGGLGQEAALISLAKQTCMPAEIIGAFDACTQRFTSKMLYTKTGLQITSGPGSMYLVLIEPWEAVFDFLRSLPAMEENVATLETQVNVSGICFLLGFTADEATGKLVVKTYHLFDRCGSDAAEKPFLISHRLDANGLRSDQKSYTARVEWEALRTNDRWNDIATMGSNLFGTEYAILRGVLSSGSQKAYVFRFDERENESYSLKKYNYYIEEGVRFLALNDLLGAVNSFKNAIDFAPEDADAWNRLGYLYVIKGKYLKGMPYIFKARELDPMISNLIYGSRRIPVLEAKLDAASVRVEQDPCADAFNERGILWFHAKQYQKAINDFQNAIGLDQMGAEYYNNLGGTYLKTGDFVKAVKNCTIAHSINNRQSRANLDVAREALRLIKELDRTPTKQLHDYFGIFLCQLDLLDRAMEHFQKAEEMTPAISGQKNESLNVTELR